MTRTAEFWTAHLRRTLQSYDEPLLRQVSTKLCKPRNHWPVEELIDRCLGTLDNAAVLDRRLKDLEAPARLLLALIAHSRQNLWPVGSLVEMLVTLGHADGLAVVQSLLQAGLLYPNLFAPESDNGTPLGGRSRLKQLEQWLSQAMPPMVFAHPAVTERALGGLSLLPEGPAPYRGATARPLEADGLEWPLRLAVLWQQVAAGPLRRTQQRDFFKRDFDRLQNDPILSAAPADSRAALPQPGLLAVALGLACGLLDEADGDIRAAAFPDAWQQGLPATLAGLVAVLPRLEGWNPAQGWHSGATPGNPYPAACLLALLLLSQLPDDGWADPDEIERWLAARHPYWNRGGKAPDGNVPDAKNARANGKGRRAAEEPTLGIAAFLLGLAHPLRLLQIADGTEGATVVRLSQLGRWVLGLANDPGSTATFPQTLLVQPNLEILAYRQGLTPELIAALTKCATWKGLGAACTLQLEPHSVYRALESGESYASIVQMFERHGMKALPPSVLDSLRTWSNKRDRISIYPAAALFEFPGPAEMADALARGLPAVRLTDRLAIVPNESAIDYRHFRLTGTRDYCLPPEKCVDVDADGVTLSIDLARSDLLLETEVQGIAEPVNRPGLQGRRLYRLTPASLTAARQSGTNLSNLETWFQHRTGLPLSPAVTLLFTAAEAAPLEMRRQLVLHVPSSLAADGLQQWSGTRDLIAGRLGPMALAVAEEHMEELRRRCQELGLRLIQGEG